MNKYQAIHTERKDKILAEAKKLILERGISDRLMSEIALRAGISRQRLYLYYSNIDEILSDLLENVLSNSYLARIADAPNVAPPAEIIRYCILSFHDISDEAHEDLLFLSLFSVYSATNKKGLNKSQNHILLFEKQILQGQQDGIFRMDKPLSELTGTVSHILAGYTYHCEAISEQGRKQLLDKELLNRLADMILTYLKNE